MDRVQLSSTTKKAILTIISATRPTEFNIAKIIPLNLALYGQVSFTPIGFLPSNLYVFLFIS